MTRKKKEKIVPLTLEEMALLDETPQRVRVTYQGAQKYLQFDGTAVKDVIENLQSMLDKAKDEGFSDLQMAEDHYGYDGGYDLSVTGTRLETPAEIRIRLSYAERTIIQKRAYAIAAEKRRQDSEKKERALYLRLKKKFEGTSKS